MEQLVARRAHNPKVTGSSPVLATPKDSSINFEESFSFKPLLLRFNWINPDQVQKGNQERKFFVFFH